MAKKGKAKPAKPGKAKKKDDGLKLPKNLSLSGDSLAALVTSPLVRELAADVLIAVAGALASNRSPGRAAANLSANASDAGKGATSLAQTATGAVAEVMTEAARRILPTATAGDDEAKPEHAPGANAGRRRRAERPEQRREH
jgi:CelD/BcsL family acetyltransferase involved in cellulose biosynthesis